MRPLRLLVPLLLVTLVVHPAVYPAAAQEAPGTRAFNIDAATSQLTIRLYRQGVLSVLAHDHVLNADGIAGRVLYNEQDVKRSSLQLSVPVASLVVDDPERRKREGVSGTLSEKNIAEIRGIIMSEDYLDEPKYPRVVATAVAVNGELPMLSLGLSVRIKQTEKVYTVPVKVDLEGGTLHATGEVYLKQSDFGMKPYIALLGAIAVQDPVLVKFDIVAREQR